MPSAPFDGLVQPGLGWPLLARVQQGIAVLFVDIAGTPTTR